MSGAFFDLLDPAQKIEKRVVVLDQSNVERMKGNDLWIVQNRLWILKNQ